MFAALLLASLALYARAATFGFVDFDDRTILLAHPNLYDERSLLASLREITVGYLPREEPLLVRDLTWAIDARLFGFANPFGYHAGNVALNTLVVGALFAFLRRTTRSRGLAGGVALAFAALPVHVEPVAWVMGRKDLLAALFVLGALLAQSRELAAATPAGRRAGRVLAFVCCALALGSKISAVACVLVLALHRWFHPCLEGQRSPAEPLDPRAAAVRALPPLLPHALLTVAVFLWYRAMVSTHGVGEGDGPGPLDPEHLRNVALFLPLIAGEYLRHLVWPHDLSLYYRWPHVEIPLTGGELALSAALALGLLGLLALALRRRRDLAFYALFALALLAPYCGLFYVGFWHADRYFYLASAGVVCVAALGLRDLTAGLPAARAAAVAAGVAFVAGSAAFTWSHLPVWRDNASLWTYEASRDEPSVLALRALAQEQLARADRAASEAERDAWLARAAATVARGFARDEALGRRPGRYHTPEQLQLARLHSLTGLLASRRGASPADQAAHFRRAFALAPNRRDALLLAGSLYAWAQTQPPDRQAELVRESFDYFELAIRFSRSDPVRLAESRRLLESQYEGRFPYLAQRIDEARRSYFP